ncbi:hypothetical protein DFP72DRAFT_860263 [Ephemerocybe angulata]|uniref:Uncharacterized protein n=1 Tax=Ephemerocybe angulata TaxID=980116 RepID=A0A8H6HB75_9AGAR|nr:hypothetical protein DFP72DRAFT_860263 [Tulosesus angulatus]
MPVAPLAQQNFLIPSALTFINIGSQELWLPCHLTQTPANIPPPPVYPCKAAPSPTCKDCSDHYINSQFDTLFLTCNQITLNHTLRLVKFQSLYAEEIFVFQGRVSETEAHLGGMAECCQSLCNKLQLKIIVMFAFLQTWGISSPSGGVQHVTEEIIVVFGLGWWQVVPEVPDCFKPSSGPGAASSIMLLSLGLRSSVSAFIGSSTSRGRAIVVNNKGVVEGLSVAMAGCPDAERRAHLQCLDEAIEQRTHTSFG